MYRLIRLFCLLAAFTAYAANGAQAHLHFSTGETIEVPMCVPGSGHDIRMTTIQLTDDGPVEITHFGCGECTAPAATPGVPEIGVMAPATGGLKTSAPFAPAVYPRSPLWPGAPPQGPPSPRTA
ncbi:MAG: hypothetical protein AAGI03_12210 [Pseudomonadota bacterium]